MIPVARPDVGYEERRAVDRVLASGMLAQGSEVLAFEREFSEVAVPGARAIAVNSGTSALHLTMVALGIGPGDEVIVPSFTFAATANCVAFTGAKPIFADIDPDTFTLEPGSVEAAIGPRTRGIIPVHLFGHPADLSALAALCERHEIWMVEDAAQAHLASWMGQLVGTWGVAGTFSFYPTKNMTSGEGGMVSTANPELERRVSLLRNQGQERRYFNEIVGLNNRMTDIHAAIGRVQLSALGERTRRRQEIAAFFDRHLRDVRTPKVLPGAAHVYHQYTIRVEGHDRDRFADELAKRGIGTGVYYPTPIHRLPAYDLAVELPKTQQAATEVLSLPVYPSLTETELELIVTAVNETAAAGSLT